MNKKIFFSLILALLFSGFLPVKVQAAQCAANECGDGEFVCESGTMCCTCSTNFPNNCGCPSWSCQQYGAGYNYIGESWCEKVETSCIAVPPSFPDDMVTCHIGTARGRFGTVKEAFKIGGTCRSCGGGGTCFSCVAPGECPANRRTSTSCGQPNSGKIKCQTSCGGGGGGCTNPTSIGSFLFTTSPANNATFQSNVNITFAWGDPQNYTCTGGYGPRDPITHERECRGWGYATKWGECGSCSSCPSGYRLYVDGQVRGVYNKSTKSATLAATIFGTGQHSWYVQAYNGDAGTATSSTYRFTVSSTNVGVRGYIWNATGQSCTSNPSSSLEIQQGSQPGNISGNITVNVDGSINGTWNPSSYNGYSYEVTNVPTGNHVLNASVPDPVGYPNAHYNLVCVNNQAVGVGGFTASADPTSVHLGYAISSQSWFQAISGDVFGGCNEDNCADSISVSLPASGSILGGFADYLVATAGTVFGNSGISVTSNNYSQDSNRHLEYIASDKFWPSSFTFIAPSSAEDISSCNSMFSGSLDPTKVYKASVSCVQSGLTALSGNYSISANGVVVIYVEGTGTLSFTKDFTSSNSSRRILFITQGPVEFSEDIGSLAPTTSSSANIQASIISAQNITFLTNSPAEDSTIILEGPLVSKDGSVVMDRDRGASNGYPAIVVKYNSLYLTALTASKPAGVSAVDISWVLE